MPKEKKEWTGETPEYALQYFLAINKIASDIVGHMPLNFAELILEEEQGRWANRQMTKHYYLILENMGRMFDFSSSDMELEFVYEELAKLTKKELDSLYNKYVCGRFGRVDNEET